MLHRTQHSLRHLRRFLFDQVKAIAPPGVLTAGEQALAVRAFTRQRTVGAELNRLNRKLNTTNAERRRLLDLCQAGLPELTGLQHRATATNAPQ
jgi:hypothetical protein